MYRHSYEKMFSTSEPAMQLQIIILPLPFLTVDTTQLEANALPTLLCAKTAPGVTKICIYIQYKDF